MIITPSHESKSRKLQSIKSIFRKSKSLEKQKPIPSDAGPSYQNDPDQQSSTVQVNTPLDNILNDREEYNKLLHSLEEVKELNTLRADLRRNNLDLARKNLEQGQVITQLQNQCNVIRSRVATVRENLEHRVMELSLSTPDPLDRLQKEATTIDEQSEELQRKFLAGDVDLLEFCQGYRKQRVIYHKKMLLKIAAETCT